uniref:RNA-directed DNA polymerase n=1 Tax=Strongyloides papillosus TaxID=174720 RepID=A0A0N5B4G8_STREA
YDNKKGNYVKAKKVENNVFDEEEENDDEDCNNVMMIGLVEGDQKIMMRTVIKFGNDTIDKEMEADTGCQNTIVPDTWLNENQLRELDESQFKFIKSVGGGKKKVLGNLKCKLEVISKNGVSKEIETELMIIEDLQDALLGRKDLYRLKLLDDLQSMAVKVISVEEDKHLDEEVLDFKKKFPILTSNPPGHVKGVLLKVKKKKDRTKYFCKPREYKSDVLKDLVNKKIEYYIEQVIFEPIMYSDEAYPIVPVLKGLSKVKDQTKLTIDNVRITGNFSLYNKGLEIPSVRIKTVNGELEKINKIRGRGELIYSIFDLSDGYTALEMELGTRTVLSTPKGLMLMKRLSQGLAPAPALYSMFMENKVVSVIESMIKKRNLENRVQILNITDDLMVVSRSKEDNKDVVEMLGRILEDLNVRVNIKKVKINKKEVESLVVTIGIYSENGKSRKVIGYEGLCNTMIRFVKDLALYKRKLEKKLNGIRTKKEAHKFEKFNEEEIKAFEELMKIISKKMIENSLIDAKEILEYRIQSDALDEAVGSLLEAKFNEEEIKAFEELMKIISKKMIENSLIDAKEILEYRIQSDASDEAVGSLLEAKVRTDDGMKWLPIECHSRCFQGSQKKWPIQHKEAFGLYDAVKRWFGRIIGMKTTLVTDHESLSKVFSPGPNGLVNKTYSARIWRWAQFLLSVGNLEVAYRGQKAVAFADCLSRLTDADSLCDEEDEIIVANHVNLLEKRTFTNEEVKEVAKCDVEYQSWVQEIEKNEIPVVFRKQDDVHMEKGLIKVGVKTVLPYDMQKEMINIAHETHMGKRGIKYRLEREFWWPTMLKDIETVCLTCEYCIRYMRSANKTEKRWEDANYFLQRIHMDQGQFYNTNSSFLVMRDAFTGYVHGKIVNSERPKEAIEFINEIERFFGTISTIVVDQQRSLVSN